METLTFKNFLIEQMGGSSSEDQKAVRIEDMTPDDMIKMARLKKANPKMASVDLLKRLRIQLKTEQDPKQRLMLQNRIRKIQQGENESTM